MDNVIEQNKLGGHTIQRYRFKVLGSGKADAEMTEETHMENSVDETLTTKKSDVDESSQNQFIEELLKKSDTLSTNIIKLQLQIEKQEKEFENRLKESVAREKEISFNEGYSKAKDELESNYLEKVSNYIESVRRLEEKIGEFDSFFEKVEKNLLDTSLEVAKEVIVKEISNSSSQIAVALARELMNDLKDANKISLKVNPKDFDMVNEVFVNNPKVDVQSDTAISSGGVVLLSDSGNLDGNISARLEKIKFLLQNESSK